ncbi:hypothetical protein FRB93_004312 [Tulasnella sp. JGI-2019a]|nr:hypothetical protein FRB93_004312 [Tulasnella sp. JGI-2019a]
MLDFGDTHSKRLLDSPWIAKVHGKTGYLLKFSVSDVDLSCCVIITDTERVWAEVLESRHMARRSRQCNKSDKDQTFSQPLNNAEKETEWRKIQLIQLMNLHSPYNMSDIEFSVGTSDNADLEVTLTTDDFTWRWDAMSLPSRMASQILSTHLVMPLLSFTALAASVDEPLRNMSTYSLTRAADSQAKTAKRGPGRQMVGCMGKPIILTSLQRITQIMEGSANPVPVAVSEEDYPALPDVPPLPRTSSPSSSPGKRRRTPPPPRYAYGNKLSSPELLSSQQTQTSHRNEPGSDTEEDDGPLPPVATHITNVTDTRRRPRIATPSAPRGSSGANPNAEDEEEDEEADAEARRRAAITQIVQDTKSAAKPGISVKAAAKRRRF